MEGSIINGKNSDLRFWGLRKRSIISEKTFGSSLKKKHRDPASEGTAIVPKDKNPDLNIPKASFFS